MKIAYYERWENRDAFDKGLIFRAQDGETEFRPAVKPVFAVTDAEIDGAEKLADACVKAVAKAVKGNGPR